MKFVVSVEDFEMDREKLCVWDVKDWKNMENKEFNSYYQKTSNCDLISVENIVNYHKFIDYKC